MSISVFAIICATATVLLLTLMHLVFLFRRKNGKSDIRQSRISLVIASFAVPIIVTTLFVIFALVMQQFYDYRIPVGQHGGGVFIVLLTTIATAIMTLLILLPRIKHKWED